jgi:2-hydroxy-3-keto-5-methylthiopentenyl-1-phosphate phosphatase
MSDKVLKRYLFASDFDQTLTFNDSGYVLSEIIGIPTEEFKRKAAGMAKINLVQQGAELAYLLLHDPEFRLRVRREHLYQVGKKIRLKNNIGLLYEILDHGIEGYQFDFSILSAAPVEVIQSALEGIVPPERIYGTQFQYNAKGEIETIVRATAGYGKVAVLDQLQSTLQIGPDHIVYAGDGSSDVHVMLHVNARDGFTIAVSESKQVAHVAKRTVLGNNAMIVLAPILENIVGWSRPHIREFLESYGFLIQEWDSVRTDWLTLRAIDDATLTTDANAESRTETIPTRSK